MFSPTLSNSCHYLRLILPIPKYMSHSCLHASWKIDLEVYFFVWYTRKQLSTLSITYFVTAVIIGWFKGIVQTCMTFFWWRYLKNNVGQKYSGNQNCLVINILQTIFYLRVQQKKKIHVLSISFFFCKKCNKCDPLCEIQTKVSN